MGFRTVVILSNDHQHEWSKDPWLGEKIARAAPHAMGNNDDNKRHFDYGSVEECCHADQQTLAVIDSLTMTQLAHSSWARMETPEEINLKMLKLAAEKLGYRLVRVVDGGKK